MNILREVVEGAEGTAPFKPEDGWNIGILAHIGVLLSCEGFSARFDLHNLNLLFDYAEDFRVGNIKDSEGRIIEVRPEDDGIVLTRQDDKTYPHGVILDHDSLDELGIETGELEDQIEDADPETEFDSLTDDDTIDGDDTTKFDTLEEGIKRAYRRSGKKIKRGYRVTSGFRKGRVVSSPKAAFKPRAKASTRSKLRLAARRKKVIRVMRAKRTRRLPTSRRLVRMNKSRR